MLPSQLNFQMMNFLAFANEAEVTRFNDARMNRTNANAMKLFALYVEKWVVIDAVALSAVVTVPNGLKPGVTNKLDAPSLVHLSLEGMQRRALGGERAKHIAIFYCGSKSLNAVRGIVGYESKEFK